MKFLTKKNIIKSSFLVFMLALPFVTMAAANNVESGLNQSRLVGLFGTGGISGSRNLTELIYAAIRLMLTFAGAIAVLFVVYGGFQYLTAQGNDEQAEKGKTTLVNAMMGIVIIILSYALVAVVVNLVSYGSGLFG